LISLWSRTWWVVIKNMRIAQLLALRKQHAMLLTFISHHLSHERRKCNLLQKFKERRAERISNEDIIIRSPRFRNYKDNTTRVLVRLFCI
jgi:ABC-type oligopeptide transport system ATPase subunit